AAGPGRLQREAGAVRRRIHGHRVQRAAAHRARLLVRAGDEEARAAPRDAVAVTSPDRAPRAHGTRVNADAVVWLFWSAVWLGVVFIAVKALYLMSRADPGGDGRDDLSSLAAITYRDVMFVLAVWAIARLALTIVRPRLARGVIVAGFVLFATATAFYAIGSVILFGILGGFLTHALLQLVGNTRMIGSSVSAYLTPRVAAGLIGVPSAYLGIVVLPVRARAGLRVGPWSARTLPPMFAIAWVIAGQRTFVADWATRYDWRIADNAPWVLASTSWRAMTTGERIVQLSDQFVAA